MNGFSLSRVNPPGMGQVHDGNPGKRYCGDARREKGWKLQKTAPSPPHHNIQITR
jgi:hypothetical protein